eukprot:764142-Hanusia_phi.AAC.3
MRRAGASQVDTGTRYVDRRAPGSDPVRSGPPRRAPGPIRSGPGRAPDSGRLSGGGPPACHPGGGPGRDGGSAGPRVPRPGSPGPGVRPAGAGVAPGSDLPDLPRRL